MLDHITKPGLLEAIVFLPLYLALIHLPKNKHHDILAGDTTVKLVGRLWLVDGFCMCRTVLVSRMVNWITDCSGKNLDPNFNVSSSKVSANGTSVTDNNYKLLKCALKSFCASLALQPHYDWDGSRANEVHSRVHCPQRRDKVLPTVRVGPEYHNTTREMKSDVQTTPGP